MGIFDSMQQHEELIFAHDESSGLRAIIGIHDTTLGPALGGCRVWPYKSEEEAVTDVLRLSRGMTYKAAISGLNLGGGKSVIIAKPEDCSEAMFRALGRYIDGLHGRYITAEDVNTTVQYMDWVNSETNYVTGTSNIASSGNPSIFTAYGVFLGIKAAVKHKLKKDDLKGVRIAVQGLGNVSRNLCGFLHKEGALLSVCDLSEERLEQAKKDWGASVVGLEEIYSVDCDVFSPNALGATINDNTISQLKASIVAGAANNQLHEARHGDELDKRGILYVPDYLINAGGLINVYTEIGGYSAKRSKMKVETLYNIMAELFVNSDKESVPTYKMADLMAECRIEAVRKTKRIFKSREMTSAAEMLDRSRPVADKSDVFGGLQ